MTQRYCFVCEDGHNYLIPVERRKEFYDELDTGDEDGWATFNNKFDEYRCDSFTNYTFTDPR